MQNERMKMKEKIDRTKDKEQQEEKPHWNNLAHKEKMYIRTVKPTAMMSCDHFWVSMRPELKSS